MVLIRKLTLDCMQHTTVQRLTAGVIGGGTDAGSTAVGQSAPVSHSQRGRELEQIIQSPNLKRTRPRLTDQRKQPAVSSEELCVWCLH